MYGTPIEVRQIFQHASNPLITTRYQLYWCSHELDFRPKIWYFTPGFFTSVCVLCMYGSVTIGINVKSRGEGWDKNMQWLQGGRRFGFCQLPITEMPTAPEQCQRFLRFHEHKKPMQSLQIDHWHNLSQNYTSKLISSSLTKQNNAKLN